MVATLLLFVGLASAGTPTDPVPAFSLTDTNTTSKRAGQSVSPRDYLGKVSAWYFGHGD